MKKMTFGILVITCMQTFSANAAKIDLLCSGSSAESCASRVTAALEKMGCEPESSTVDCQVDVDFEWEQYCTIQTSKCMEPSPDLVFTTHCNEGEKIGLRRYDSGLSLTWWMGFGPYLRSVCKK